MSGGPSTYTTQLIKRQLIGATIFPPLTFLPLSF
jgi:hypothetical protein